MADPQTVIEGSLKYRDGKKWKPRWCVVRKLSPVADCLHLQLYRDSKERCNNVSTKASLSLQGFLGLETGFTLDKESNTMAVICKELVVVLAFDSREILIQWQVKVRATLLEEQQFLVQIAHVPSRSKLSCGPARLHLQDFAFCLTAGVPPRLLGVWPLKELRRFGVVDSKFCFEGGSYCGRGEGLHVLLTNQAKDLAQSFDLASRGRLIGKRKLLPRKQAGSDGSSRLALQPKLPDKRGCDTCSTESTKPLISSGSDGSCDACDDDPTAACRVHYRWPVCIVPCGSRDADDPAQHGTFVRQSSLQSQLNLDTSALWALAHCTKCGRRCSVSLDDRERHAEEGGFTPQWTMDLVSPSRDGTRYRSKDRSSLCSQSSGSSSSSSGAGSEYSVPRSCLEAFYDRPRTIQQDQRGLGPILESDLFLCHGAQSWTKSLPAHRDSEMPSASSSGSSSASPSTSPRKSAPPPLFQVPVFLPCTCGKAATYVHYAVPRSTLAHAVMSEPSKRADGDMDTSPSLTEDSTAKDCDPKEENGNRPSEACACQRVMLWASSLTPNWRRPENANLTPGVGQQTECTCRSARFLHRQNSGPSSTSHMYVNLQYLHETVARPYYANMHFLATLPLYENANLLVSASPPQEKRPAQKEPCGHKGQEQTRPPAKSKPQQRTAADVYEMMSFEEVEEAAEDNYLLMQPVYPAPPGDQPEATLPLRPFMPVLLPFAEKQADGEEAPGDLPERKCGGGSCRSSRSNSLGDLKKKALMRTRSSSAEGRQETEEFLAARLCAPPVQKLLSKLPLCSKEKSFSTDEITPPSSAPSSPDNIFLESLRKYPFHRSADCLQLREEYRLSEEDLTQDFDATTDDSAKPRPPVGIKRSCSAPCKSHTTHHSTDSGIATAFPNSGAVFSQVISVHGSLPRSDPKPATSAKLHGTSPRHEAAKTPQPARENSSQLLIISECNKCHQLVTTPVVDAKSTASTSSSDMSDYIETLSLCSRSSTSSGGSSDYIRAEDLCGAIMKLPASCTSALRPRSGKEYHAVDRVVFQEEHTLEGSTLHLVRFSELADRAAKTSPLKTNSPSPGYVSSSPGHPDCGSDKLFVFPKDGKELNYLEVSTTDSEPPSPALKSSAVQYAIIDVVATAAAKKLSSERATEREHNASADPADD